MSLRSRGRSQVSRPHSVRQLLSRPFVLVCCIGYGMMSIYHLFEHIVGGDKKELLTENLGLISKYVRLYNQESSDFLGNLDTLLKAYSEPYNLFQTHSGTINTTRDLLISQGNYFLQKNPKYTRLREFLSDIHPHKEELFEYMGAYRPKNYIILLQNSSEQRPNGGFFGSRAYVRVLHGKIMAMNIVDSYLPSKVMSGIQITPPARSQQIYGKKPFGRVASNKFGFTNIDGETIINLYNQTFNAKKSERFIPESLCHQLCDRSIDGVIFIQTKHLKQLLPILEYKTREWQFVNASIDLIRGQNVGNKKEYYLRDVQNVFYNNILTLLTNLINSFDNITNQYSIGIYLPHSSDPLRQILDKYHLTTLPSQQMIYARDTNTLFNKIDEFITKELTLKDENNTIILQQRNNNHLAINDLKPGNYQLHISYTINIPSTYKKYINHLQEKYNISLTPRERTILALDAGIDYQGVARLRETKSQLYYPDHIRINAISGSDQHFFFTSPFGQGLNYITMTDHSPSQKEIIIDMTITDQYHQ